MSQTGEKENASLETDATSGKISRRDFLHSCTVSLTEQIDLVQGLPPPTVVSHHILELEINLIEL